MGATDDIFISDRTAAEIGAYRAKVKDAMFRGLKTALSLHCWAWALQLSASGPNRRTPF